MCEKSEDAFSQWCQKLVFSSLSVISMAVKNNTKPRAETDAAIFIQTAESERANERRTPFCSDGAWDRRRLEWRRRDGPGSFVRPWRVGGEWFMTPCHVHNLAGKTAISPSLYGMLSRQKYSPQHDPQCSITASNLLYIQPCDATDGGEARTGKAVSQSASHVIRI